MFDDPNEELKRLEKELLKAEKDDWLDRELAEAKALLNMQDESDEYATQVFRAQSQTNPQPRNYANNYGAAPVKNTDRADVDMDTYSDEIEEEPTPKTSKGLVILACLETLALVAVVAYWVLFQL